MFSKSRARHIHISKLMQKPAQRFTRPSVFSRLLKYILLLGLSALLSSLTIVFGAVPMRMVRRSFGRWPYWLGHAAVVAAMFALGFSAFSLLVLALVFMTGAYTEVEEHGGAVFASGLGGVLAGLGAGAVALGAKLYVHKAALLNELRAQIAPLVDRMAQLNPKAQITIDTVLQQLPSGFVITLMIALSFALIWERRLLTWSKLQEQKEGVHTVGLRSFQVPGATVWLSMLAILGAFLQHGNHVLEMVSVNLLNILAVLYFFQGLAVVATAFEVFKVGRVWQTLWYIMIVLQLFLLVSLLGFADYWVEFRQRLSRKPTEAKNSFNFKD